MSIASIIKPRIATAYSVSQRPHPNFVLNLINNILVEHVN